MAGSFGTSHFVKYDYRDYMNWSGNIKQLLSNRSSASTALAQGEMDIEGDFFFKAPGRIESTLKGTFKTRHSLEIGPAGHLFGPLEADKLTIQGTTEGPITCQGHVGGLEGGRARGPLKAGSLQISKGFDLEGSLHIGPA
jgi:cytoskeletal protein CcmA (bactofilin family)